MWDEWKVVTSAEMARIEKLAYEEGCLPSDFMEEAGKQIALATEEFIKTNQLERVVTLLVGKGNNGGDALVAGRYLHKRKFQVTAYFLEPLASCSPLCKKAAARFRGKKLSLQDDCQFPNQGVILDGLLGTGFQGKLTDHLKSSIEKANGSKLPVLAIDIPSGLNGTTGEIDPIAIQATQTLFLQMPKWGFFINEGWNYVGKLCPIDFGLPSKYVERAEAKAILPKEECCHSLFPPIKRKRHKYQAGYVIALAGSAEMAGAAFLSCFAAMRSGAGIVRLFYSHALPEGAPWEIIRTPLDVNLVNLMEQTKRAQSCLVGPGLGRTEEVKQRLIRLFSELSIAVVIDADALYFFSEYTSLPKSTVLTPHMGEMERLLGEMPTHALCQKFVEEKKVTLILKGTPSTIFHPKRLPTIMPFGDPGMATAGSGDVLTGIVAGLLAQGLSAYDAALVGLYLHGRAGEFAAARKTSYSLIASDIIDDLPNAFSRTPHVSPHH